MQRATRKTLSLDAIPAGGASTSTCALILHNMGVKAQDQLRVWLRDNAQNADITKMLLPLGSVRLT